MNTLVIVLIAAVILFGAYMVYGLSLIHIFLLTRARQGMVIFVPRGVEEEEDATRDYRNYDKIYEYLISCGIKEL